MLQSILLKYLFMLACITNNVNKRKLSPGQMCAAAAIDGCDRGRIQYNPQGEVVYPACGCLVCRKEEEKSGSHSPFATSDSDWLPQSKSPIREPPLILLTEEGE